MKTIYRNSAILGLVIFFVFIFLFKIQDRMTDFQIFYSASQRFIAGEDLYQITDGYYQFKYPPVFALFVSPIGLMPPPVAKAVWYVSILFAIFFTLFLSFKMVGSEIKKWKYIVLPSVLVLAKFYFKELDLGQVNSLLGLSIILMVWFWLKEKPVLAGICLGLACMIKPYALIFFPYLLLKRDFKQFITASFLIVVAMLTPLFKYGTRDTFYLLAKWKSTLSQSAPHLLDNIDNVSIIGFLNKWMGVENASLTRIIWLILVILLGLAFAYAVLRRPSHTPNAVLVESGILLVYIPLFAPLGWDYIFLISSLSLMIIFTYWSVFSRKIQIFLIINFCLIGLTIYDILGDHIYTLFMKSSLLTINYICISLALIYIRINKVLTIKFV